MIVAVPPWIVRLSLVSPPVLQTDAVSAKEGGSNQQAVPRLRPGMCVLHVHSAIPLGTCQWAQLRWEVAAPTDALLQERWPGGGGGSGAAARAASAGRAYGTSGWPPRTANPWLRVKLGKARARTGEGWGGFRGSGQGCSAGVEWPPRAASRSVRAALPNFLLRTPVMPLAVSFRRSLENVCPSVVPTPADLAPADDRPPERETGADHSSRF